MTERGSASGEDRFSDPLASIGQRIGSRLLDWFVLLAVWLPIGALTAERNDDDVLSYPLWARIAWAAVVVAYEVGFVAQRGQTPGKHLVGIGIVSAATGQRLSVPAASARVAPVIIAMSVFFVFFPVAMVFVYFSAAFMADRRGVLDRLAGSAVVQTRQGPAAT